MANLYSQNKRELKRRALSQAKSLFYWFRQKYNLPLTDPRYLGMTQIEIEMEYMTHLYREVLDKGREPDLDEFETTEVDKAVEQWAKEDDEFLDAFAQRNRASAWEEVNIHE